MLGVGIQRYLGRCIRKKRWSINVPDIIIVCMTVRWTNRILLSSTLIVNDNMSILCTNQLENVLCPWLLIESDMVVFLWQVFRKFLTFVCKGYHRKPPSSCPFSVIKKINLIQKVIFGNSSKHSEQKLPQIFQYFSKMQEKHL